MAIGVWGGIAGLGGAIAPTLGALLVDAAGWRAVFFINLPFVAAALVAGLAVLPRSEDRQRERFDPVAVPLAAIAVGALVLVIVEVADWGWTDPRTLGALLVVGDPAAGVRRPLGAAPGAAARPRPVPAAQLHGGQHRPGACSSARRSAGSC